MTDKSKAKSDKKGALSPFEAICVAVGGAVGVGSIGGVAAAIAVGGPICVLVGSTCMGILRNDG